MILRAAIAAGQQGNAEAVSEYVFPILSTDAQTFDISDWTQELGNLYQKDATSYFVLTDSTDRARHYQTFSIPAGFHPAIDAGNGLIDISNVVGDFSGDTDGATAFAEWRDAGDAYLGRTICPHIQNNAGVVGVYEEVTNQEVPPGARSVRIGWQGYREAGVESSCYVTDLQATLKTGSLYADAEMIFSEKSADATGWSGVVGGVTVLAASTSDDWEPAGPEAKYTGGPSNATNEIEKNFSLPGGWAARIAAGSVKMLVRSSVFRANDADDVEIKVTFDPSGSPTLENNAIATNYDIIAGDLTVDVPVGASDFDLGLRFTRGDGAYNDGGANQFSIWLVEVA